MGDERIIHVPGCDDWPGQVAKSVRGRCQQDAKTVRKRSQQVAKLVRRRCQAIAKLVRKWCQTDRENGEEKVQRTVAKLVKRSCDDLNIMREFGTVAGVTSSLGSREREFRKI